MLKGAGDSIYRKSVGRDDPARRSLAAGGFRGPNNSKQEAPSATACGGDSSLKEGAFPGGGRRFFYRLGFSRSGRFVSAPFYLSLWERWHGAAVTERAALPSDK